jgi:hypothetical protein
LPPSSSHQPSCSSKLPHPQPWPPARARTYIHNQGLQEPLTQDASRRRCRDHRLGRRRTHVD